MRNYAGAIETAEWKDVVKGNASKVSWTVGGQMPSK